jgi:hypothetical protein
VIDIDFLLNGDVGNGEAGRADSKDEESDEAVGFDMLREWKGCRW